MNTDKNKILAEIIAQLRADLSVCEQAVKIARDTATHADALGSSQYETMGLEASYLAQGQGLRLLEVERSLAYFLQLKLPPYTGVIALSSLVAMRDEQGDEQLLWLAADAGGLKIPFGELSITVVTPKSPLGAELIGKVEGDDLEVRIAGATRCYEVCAVY
jgi:transcription elongation GreA/GreB family factor